LPAGQKALDLQQGWHAIQAGTHPPIHSRQCRGACLEENDVDQL
jgi:hypothetical protein